MSALLNQKCRSRTGQPPMSDTAIRDHLDQVSGWRVDTGSIEKTFTFTDFHATISFVNGLAWICNAEDHHPELLVTYSRCVVRFSTHSIGGISINDFVCAAKADALVALVG